MESGEIVEYIDANRIISAVVMEGGNKRLKLLTEHNREIKVAAQRLSHRGRTKLDVKADRNRLVAALQDLASKRNTIADTVRIKELWGILNQEEAWIDLKTMTGLCFPRSNDDNHESGVIRALFKSRRYFRFRPDRFWPHTEAQVEAIIAAERQTARQQQLIENGAKWIQSVRSGPDVEYPADHRKLSKILASYYLFEKESPHYKIVQTIMKKAEVTSPEAIFNHLVAVGVWSQNENVDLLRYKIPIEFPRPALDHAQSISTATRKMLQRRGRVDLTSRMI